VTFATAILGVVGFSLKEGINSALSVALLGAGALAWAAFYFMDRWWYHRYLNSAVDQGRRVEGWLAEHTGTPVFGLAGEIKTGSPVQIGGRKLRSPHRIDLFYGGFLALFVVLAVVFFRLIPRTAPAPEPQTAAMQPTGGPTASTARDAGAAVAPVGLSDAGVPAVTPTVGASDAGLLPRIDAGIP
jgi:hypothetical protein